MHPSDVELLRRFADHAPDAQAAFATLAERHLNLVYSVALRHVRSSQLAEDVAQSVFVDLARHAPRFDPTTPLVAWLHLVARRSAIDVVRRESRRQARERAAVALATMHPDSPPPDWSAIEPLLDEAVESLPARDRTAILLRYFENKSLRDIGAVIGSSDDATQKRLTRALDHLRTFFVRRGITVTATALASDLSAHALRIAPAGLGQAIAAAGAALPATAITTAITTLAMTTFQKLGLATALVATAVVVYEANHLRKQRDALAKTREQLRTVAIEVTALRAERQNATDRLARLQSQLEAHRRASHVQTASGDAALAGQINEWLTQVDQLKTFVAGHRQLAIPELQFLSDEHWFEAATATSLRDDRELRLASSGLRRRAEGMFAAKLNVALSAYVKAHDGQLPGAPEALLPFFASPIDAALLGRYEMLQHGRAADVPEQPRNSIIRVKVPADPELDTCYSIGLRGYSSTRALDLNFEFAERSFRQANPDRFPIAAIELVSFLKWPVDPATLQPLLDRQQTRRMNGASR